MEARLNETLYNDVHGIANDLIFSTPVIVRYMKKNLDITKPRYSEQIWPVPWPFVISEGSTLQDYNYDLYKLSLALSRCAYAYYIIACLYNL